jgi:hypothetical protein
MMETSQFTRFITAVTLTTVVGCGGNDADGPTTPMAAQVQIVAGNDQTAVIGSSLPAPLTVSVTDLGGVSVPNQRVNWNVLSGGGTLSVSTSLTDVNGTASVTWTLGGTPGTQIVSAALEGSTSTSATFSATALTATPPPPALTRDIVLHYDGTRWTSLLQDNHNNNAHFFSVWGASASSVFTGGDKCGSALLVSYNGTSWGDISPCPPATQRYSKITGISGNSSSDIFAVERSSRASEPNRILHYDGQAWSSAYTYQPATTYLSLSGIWSRAPNDVFAVGDSGYVVHYDGASWTTSKTATSQSLFSIWGDATTGVAFAVGPNGTIVRYNGTNWQTQASGTTQHLLAVGGTSASNVFAVGIGGVLLHYDGTSWSSQSSGTTEALTGVWGSSATSVFVVGNHGTVLRYNGMSWTPEQIGFSANLAGIWGTSPTNVFAVAGY